MKRVHFLIDRRRIVDYFLTAIRASRGRLKDRGYDVHFYRKPTRKALSCDILGLITAAGAWWWRYSGNRRG